MHPNTLEVVGSVKILAFNTLLEMQEAWKKTGRIDDAAEAFNTLLEMLFFVILDTVVVIAVVFQYSIRDAEGHLRRGPPRIVGPFNTLLEMRLLGGLFKPLAHLLFQYSIRDAAGVQLDCAVVVSVLSILY